ncbi:hypothetical protein MPSEU_000015700 [Mayamaea pseudoterrestris]|nr:hypothetical protein MPSEU_000015700 [Mayamaea pseudoterrestris]
MPSSSAMKDSLQNAPIRPVCRRLPFSQKLWEDSNLPFGLVVTPLAANASSADASSSQSLSLIPKCLQCGAPHAIKETHFRLPAPSEREEDARILCYLCGATSFTSKKLQQAKREAVEGPIDLQQIQQSSKKTDPFLFDLPLRLPSTEQQSSIPAIACPPLWFILLDGTCTSPSYWKATSHVLLQALSNIPSHVHVSLLIASHNIDDGNIDDNTDNANVMSIFQLTSPIPHLLHYSEKNRNDLVQAIANSLTDGMHRSHLQTAVRSLLDYKSNQFSIFDDEFLAEKQHTSSSKGIHLAWCVETILDVLQSHGQVAGQRQDMNVDDGGSKFILKRPYAGAKLTCLLSQQPSGVCRSNQRSKKSSGFMSRLMREKQQQSTTATPTIGMGGFGGRIASQADRKINSQQSTSTTDVQNGHSGDATADAFRRASVDLTPGQLEETYQPLPDIALYMDELGRQCAQAATGVDLLFLLEQPDDEHSSFKPLALPLYGHLASKSGAPGPLLFDCNDETSMDRLERELAARVPWREGMVFAAELRLRLPLGFVVDDAALETSREERGPQLAPLWVDAGLMGPASSVDDSKQLWRMGICDAFTSFAIDLRLKDATAPREISVPGLGTVATKPVVQTCFAYTTIEKDDCGTYIVKRRMRIHSCPVPLANESEMLYTALDTEALTVVLFHKLAIALFQDGIAEGVNVAEDWLISTLVAIYNSAEEYHEQTNNKATVNGNGSNNLNFLSHERLLDQEGEFSTDDVLLAQGHILLRRIVLIIYQLMQCHAFRVPHDNFIPSSDLRHAALCQMQSMPPQILNRCIRPLLQAWLSGMEATEPVIDAVELRRKSVRLAVEEFSKYDDVLFFLNSPSIVALLDGRTLEEQNKGSQESSALLVNAKLQSTVSEACLSYRAKLDVIYSLGGEIGTYDSMDILSDVLIRDMASASGHANFTKWKKDIAARVLE